MAHIGLTRQLPALAGSLAVFAILGALLLALGPQPPTLATILIAVGLLVLAAGGVANWSGAALAAPGACLLVYLLALLSSPGRSLGTLLAPAVAALLLVGSRSAWWSFELRRAACEEAGAARRQVAELAATGLGAAIIGAAVVLVARLRPPSGMGLEVIAIAAAAGLLIVLSIAAVRSRAHDGPVPPLFTVGRSRRSRSRDRGGWRFRPPPTPWVALALTALIIDGVFVGILIGTLAHQIGGINAIPPTVVHYQVAPFLDFGLLVAACIVLALLAILLVHAATPLVVAPPTTAGTRRPQARVSELDDLRDLYRREGQRGVLGPGLVRTLDALAGTEHPRAARTMRRRDAEALLTALEPADGA